MKITRRQLRRLITESVSGNYYDELKKMITDRDLNVANQGAMLLSSMAETDPSLEELIQFSIGYYYKRFNKLKKELSGPAHPFYGIITWDVIDSLYELGGHYAIDADSLSYELRSFNPEEIEYELKQIKNILSELQRKGS
tara:strand:- start:283 stop:702 length:420 start_codon:yes stop_codon:yes gene_type:complete